MLKIMWYNKNVKFERRPVMVSFRIVNVNNNDNDNALELMGFLYACC